MKQFIELHRIEHSIPDEKDEVAKVVYIKVAFRKNEIWAILEPFSRTPNALKEYDTAVTVKIGNVSFKVKESYELILAELEL